MTTLLNELSRRRKQAIAVSADLVMLPVALWSAFALRLGEINPAVAEFWPAFVICVCIAVPVFGRFGLYRQVIRYMGNYAVMAVVKGTALAALAVAVVPYMLQLNGFPRSVPIIFWALAFLYVSGSRFAVRTYIHRQDRNRQREAVIIYGAGSKGVELSRLLGQQDKYEAIAFLDDDRKVQKRSIDGIYVYPPSELGQLLRDNNVKQVLVAVVLE